MLSILICLDRCAFKLQICASADDKGGLLLCCHGKLQKKSAACWRHYFFVASGASFWRRCSRWISSCLPTKALASVWDDMCWPKSRSIFGGRRGCQHPLGLRVTDGPNHTEGQPYPFETLHYLDNTASSAGKAKGEFSITMYIGSTVTQSTVTSS